MLERKVSTSAHTGVPQTPTSHNGHQYEEKWLCESAGAGPTCLVLQLANRHSKIQHQLPLSLAPSQQIRLDPETLALNADV